MADTPDLQDIIALIRAQLPQDKDGDAVVCRVEIDLPNWLAELTGGKRWEVISETEDENCVVLSMQQVDKPTAKLAEVTLYHNGHASVYIGKKIFFHGALSTQNSNFTHLTYYHASSGKEITLH